ncbi:protein FrlC [Paenibacillus sp. UNCCL117]|uniref:sugar phosphate isomerase/epimerase family protein n=1 Tax=unclassified Paenibacillus TaxID=185978 RepID=UPI0008829036|nr:MULTISPECIES: sugar phosphate isomerase/epimerase family protein [unclassified Paenibacillus]SDE23221.1 protein FrlC [Paenibacillus sp. cl123]SFW42674.1 protein FrlC [Paenibacillus sp. UNCCL117]
MAKIANMNFHYHRYTFDYFLDSTERLGLQAIELWAGAPHLYVGDATHQEAAAMRNKIDRRGLEIVCFTPEQCIYPINLSSKDDTLRRRSIDYFKKSLSMANSLNCGRLLVTAGYGFFDEPKEDAWERARDSIGEIALEAKQAGAVLVLEPLSHFGSNVINNAADLKRMIDEVGSPNVKAMLDTVPMMLAGDTIDGYAAAFGDDLVHIHFLDGDGKTSAHLAWGEGCFPLEAFKRSLDDHGYDGYLTLEIIGPKYNWDPESATRLSLEHLRKAGF